MMLLVLIVVLLAAGILAWLAERLHPAAPRWISLAALAVDLGLLLWLWATTGADHGRWLVQMSRPWIPSLGVRLSLGLDGLSLVMLLLTMVLGLVAVGASWRLEERVGFFHACLLWVLAGIAAVFLALDLLLFYVAWELMLLPMVLLIAIWGHERRWFAALKFFVYTQAGGLLMLVAIVALALLRAGQGHPLSFAYGDLLGTELPPATALWLLGGFLAAFLVKLPAFPLHGWLPDAHTEAPTAGSIVLAGLMLKTGAYGLLRFAIPLFPDAARTLAPVAMSLGVFGILYGALLAFSQSDLKRLVAYTSVSHLGFVLVGVFAFDRLAAAGAVLQMVAHGLSTGALFVLVGILAERTGTRSLAKLGGLWAVVPRMAVAGLLFALASLGLPGLANFVAEILVLLGSFRTRPGIAILATVGLVLATVYSLRLLHAVFFGPNRGSWRIADLGLREGIVLAVLAVGLIWLGLDPDPLLRLVAPAVHLVAGAMGAGG